MSADAISIPVADPGEQEVAMRQNTNKHSDLDGFPVVGTYNPIPVYYTFVGAGFYRSANHPVLKWASRDAFAEILYRHLYTAEQRDQLHAYLDIAYNGNRSAADDELLKDGRFAMNGDVLYVRNMYIYAEDRVVSLHEHDVTYFGRDVADVHGTATHIVNMAINPCYSRADISKLLRVRYSNKLPPELAEVYGRLCNGLPNLPDIANLRANAPRVLNINEPKQFIKLKSVPNVRRGSVINTNGTCAIISAIMMFADIPEIYQECWQIRAALKQKLPPDADAGGSTAKALTERYANDKFPIFPHIIAASVSYLNNRSATKAYRDSAYGPFLKLTDYAVQYSNSFIIHVRMIANVYKYAYADGKKNLTYVPGAGADARCAVMAALYDIYNEFQDNANIRTLLQPIKIGDNGYDHRLLVWMPKKMPAAYLRDYMQKAKTRQQYIIFAAHGNYTTGAKSKQVAPTYPIRVRNDKTGTDYVLLSYIIYLNKHTHAVYTNMAMRERVDNSSPNTTPSAMMATLHRYNTAYDESNGAQFGQTKQAVPYASVLLYHRCDTLPSQTI